MRHKVKKLALLVLSVAGLALLALPQGGQAFELKEVWPIKGGIIYENGKIARFNNGHEVDIQVLNLPKTEKIEWTVSLNGQDQTTNFLGEEKEKSMVGEEGRYLNFYVPYGYSGDIKVEAKSGDEVKTWSTKVMDDIYHGGKSSYYRLEEEKDQYTYLDTKWDYKTKTYTATLPDTSKGKKVVAWRGSQYDSVKLEKPGEITRPYNGTSLLSFYPIFETAGWFKSDSIWYYQKQGDLVKNDWLKYQGYWYFMDGAGGMIHGGWICSEDIWYYFKDSGIMMSNEWKFYNNRWYYLKSSGAMASNEWIYDQGNWYFVKSSGAMASNEWIQVQDKWYYLDSSGKMLRNTYTPDGYYVGNSGAWQ